MRTWPTPILQTFALVDLPVELHHAVMQHANISEARTLGSTCRVLKEVSLTYCYRVSLDIRYTTWGIKHLISSQNFCLRFPSWTLDDLQAEKFRSAVPRVIEKIAHLCVHGLKLLSLIRHLRLDTSGFAQIRQLIVIVAQLLPDLSEYIENSIEGLSWSFSKLVQYATGIRCIALDCVSVSVDLLRNALQHPTLNTLLMTDCRVQSITGVELPVSKSLRHIAIRSTKNVFRCAHLAKLVCHAPSAQSWQYEGCIRAMETTHSGEDEADRKSVV